MSFMNKYEDISYAGQRPPRPPLIDARAVTV